MGCFEEGIGARRRVVGLGVLLGAAGGRLGGTRVAVGSWVVEGVAGRAELSRVVGLEGLAGPVVGKPWGWECTGAVAEMLDAALVAVVGIPAAAEYRIVAAYQQVLVAAGHTG